MSFNRIWFLLLQELYITKHALEVLMDLPFFSIMSVIVFGIFSLFLSGSGGGARALYLLLGILLWEIIRVTQYSMSVGSLWNVWSRNLSNMFIAPISLNEYLLAQMFSGTIKSGLIFVLTAVVTATLFHINILDLGIINLILFFINLNIFAWSVGIIVLGFIFRYGTRIQSLAWGLIFLFQPLTAAYFPVTILPPVLQSIAYLLPPTYVFEAARKALTDSSINWSLMGLPFFMNIVYLSISLLIFNILFRGSKETGQFARNEG